MTKDLQKIAELYKKQQEKGIELTKRTKHNPKDELVDLDELDIDVQDPFDVA